MLRANAAAWSPPTPAASWWEAAPPPAERPRLCAYLPSDNHACTPASAAAVSTLSSALGELLCAEERLFWRLALHTPELQPAVDSFLRFHRRPHDADEDDVPSLEEQTLSRRVLALLLRLSTPPASSPSDHPRLLQRLGWPTFPQLLDAAALYGRVNQEVVRRVLDGCFAAAPSLSDTAARAGAAVAENLSALCERCETAGAAAGELCEAAVYFHDAALSLEALLCCRPDCARSLQPVQLLLAFRRVQTRTTEALLSASSGPSRESASLRRSAQRLPPACAALCSALQRGAPECEAASAVDMAAVAAVREMMPHLGEGYVAACLSALGGDVERATGALLDGAPPAAAAALPEDASLQAFLDSKRRPAAPPPPPPTPRPAPAPAAPPGYKKSTPRPRWAQTEASELLSAGDSTVRAAAKAAAEYVSDDETADPPSQQQWTGVRPVFDEYDDDADDDPEVAGWTAPPAADVVSDSDGDEKPQERAATPPQRPPPKQALKTFWISADGKVYNSRKEGAREVKAASAEVASRMGAAEAAVAAAAIHGLGEGGNRAAGGGVPAPRRVVAAEAAAAAGEGGGGRGEGGAGRGGAAGYARKEANKAAVGNHHRKDRAAAKQRTLLG